MQFMEGLAMLALGILIAIAVGAVLAVRWMGRRSADVTEYYADSEDTITETLLRTNGMKGNHL